MKVNASFLIEIDRGSNKTLIWQLFGVGYLYKKKFASAWSVDTSGVESKIVGKYRYTIRSIKGKKSKIHFREWRNDV